MNLRKLGEFGAIDRMAARLGVVPKTLLAPGTIGIGDDTAVIPAGGDSSTLFTIDTMVEGIHFLRDTPAEYAGFKIIAVNVSDIAAMGGMPSAAVVSLACPRATEVEWLEALYDGIAEAAERFEIGVLGGDTTAAKEIALTVAALGSCRRPAPVLRGGARPGDLVCVTGTFGGATGGLRILGMERVLKKPQEDYGHAGLRLLERHLKPEPRLAAGRALAEAGATAMIDVSDGLAADLAHICERSDCAMTIDAEAVPVNPDLAEVGDRVVPDVRVTALTGGEDFELAATLSPDALDRAVAAVEATGTSLTKIGVVKAKDGEHRIRVMLEGEEMNLEPLGWLHF